MANHEGERDNKQCGRASCLVLVGGKRDSVAHDFQSHSRHARLWWFSHCQLLEAPILSVSGGALRYLTLWIPAPSPIRAPTVACILFLPLASCSLAPTMKSVRWPYRSTLYALLHPTLLSRCLSSHQSYSQVQPSVWYKCSTEGHTMTLC